MRLIDADELVEHAGRDKLDSRELIIEMINNAPTAKTTFYTEAEWIKSREDFEYVKKNLLDANL